MSLAARVQAARDGAILEAPGGWRVRVRQLLPADFVLNPETADDAAAYVGLHRMVATEIQALQTGTLEEGIAAEIREKIQAANEDVEARRRADRLARAALLATVEAIGEPGGELEAVRLSAGGDYEPGSPQVVPLPLLRSMLGSDYDWLAEVVLWRALGGEAGQKAAIAFRSKLSAFVGGQAGAGVRGAPLGATSGVDGGATA